MFNTQENELLKQIIRQDREMVMMVDRKQSVTGVNSTPMSGNSIINSPAQPFSATLQQSAPMSYSTSATIAPTARLMAASIQGIFPAPSVSIGNLNSATPNPQLPLQQQGALMSPCSFTAAICSPPVQTPLASRTFQYSSPTASQLSLTQQPLPLQQQQQQLPAQPSPSTSSQQQSTPPPQSQSQSQQQQQPSQAQVPSPQRSDVHKSTQALQSGSLSRDVRHLSASQPSLPHETSALVTRPVPPASGESLAALPPQAHGSAAGSQAPGSSALQGGIRGTVPQRVSLFRQMSSGALPPVRTASSAAQHRDSIGSRRESAVLSSSSTETEQDKMRFTSNL